MKYRKQEAVIYLLVIAGAEVVTVFYAPLWGMLCHIAILIVIIVRSALVNPHLHERLILPLALVPLLRVINLGMSLIGIPSIVSHHLSYTPLLLSAVVVVSILRYNANDIGLDIRRNSKRLGIQLLVGATGIVLGLAGYIILRPEPIVADFARYDVWLPALILLLNTGFTAEFIFRGLIQRGTLWAFGRWGIVYVSLLFAALYIGFLSVLWVAFAFVISLYFGWIVKVTKSILGVALAHGVCNIVLYLIFPFFF